MIAVYAAALALYLARQDREREPVAREEEPPVPDDLPDAVPLTRRFVRPVPSSIRTTSRYGWRDPIPGVFASRNWHPGLDFGAPAGTNVLACGDGVVTWSAYDKGGGNYVCIDHGNGLVSRYFHLSRSLVTKGQVVSQGTVIALSGNTGTWTTGAHLHFEILLNGKTQDPEKYL